MDAAIVKTRGKANASLVAFVDAADEIPRDLVSDLAMIGWKLDSVSIPPCEDYPGECFFHKRGTDTFGAWKKDEGKRFLAELRRVLRHHKIVAPVEHRDPD